VSIALSFVQEE